MNKQRELYLMSDFENRKTIEYNGNIYRFVRKVLSPYGGNESRVMYVYRHDEKHPDINLYVCDDVVKHIEFWI